MLNAATDSDYDYVATVMEMAYLCVMRKQEILDLTLANVKPEGLLINRRKGSRSNIMQRTERLSQVWEHASALAIYEHRKQPIPIKKENRRLIISAKTGDPITSEGLSTAWQRVTELAIKKAAEENYQFTKFTLHDLKRKGITDYEGNKMAASGHRSLKILETEL